MGRCYRCRGFTTRNVDGDNVCLICGRGQAPRREHEEPTRDVPLPMPRALARRRR